MRDDEHDLSKAEARKLTDQIRGQVANVLELIAAAFDGRADVALGYSSWVRYCYAEFPAMRYTERGQRAEAVAALSARDMSNRAISDALGIDESTVRKDLRQGSGAGFPAPDHRVRGLDGKAYRRQPPPCAPVPVRATIRNALVHYARQVAALVADMDAQDYPAGFLTPAEVAITDQFRQAARDFAQTIEREHAARLAREDTE